jgi:ribose transport system permease protein
MTDHAVGGVGRGLRILEARGLALYETVGLLPVLLPLLMILLGIFLPRFLGLQNIFNVLRNSSFLVVLAAGQMLVMIVGGFDLSVGGVVALTSVVSATLMAALMHTMSASPGLVILLGVVAGLGCGLIVGLANGLCVAFLRISPFMVTLGTLSIVTGAALLLTNGIPVYGMPKTFVNDFGRALWFDLPTPVYVALAVVALIWITQNFTKTGTYLFAIGGNMDAAIVSGVSARFYLILAYALCSVLASITGLMLTAEIGSGQAVVGADTLTLQSIAAAVIAGVSLRGGVGRVELVALGAVFLLVLSNAMDLLTIDTRIQSLFLGVILVCAVGLEELAKRSTVRV